jgi:catechol 1,2-dioxygenase
MTERNGSWAAGIAALALAASSVLAGCSGTGSDTRRADTPPTSSASSSPSPTAADCHPTGGGPSQGTALSGTGASSSVKLGPGSAITPEEAAEEAPARRGTPLILTGTVYAGDCRTPLAGAVIEVWQTDARGVYGPGDGTGNLRCCYLQGTLETDSSGRYTIRTIRPGSYSGRPAHIHLNVHYRNARGVLTEVVFAGDPHRTSTEPGTEEIRLRREDGPEGKLLRGEFDIVLAAEP